MTYAAEQIGFRADAVSADFGTLDEDVMLPCVAMWKIDHYVVIYKITKRYVYVADPAIDKLRYRKEEFIKNWCKNQDHQNSKTGVLLLLEPSQSFNRVDSPRKIESESAWWLITPYLKNYRSYFAQLALSVVVISIIQLIFPFLVQSLVDQGIRNQSIHFVYIILIAQLVLFASQTFAEVIRNYLLLYVGNRISVSLLSDFLQKLMQLPQPFFEQKNLGDMLQRIHDNERIEDFFTGQALTVLFSTLSLVVFGIVLFYHHFLIFFLFVLGSAIFILWITIISKRRVKLEHERFKASAEQEVQLHDLLYGMPEIRLNGSHRRRKWRWEAARIQQHKVDTETLSVDLLQTRGGTFIHEVKNIGITFIGAYLVIQGEMTLGMLIAVQYILGQLNAPLLTLIEFLRSAQDARLSLARLKEVHAQPNENDTTAVAENLVVFGDLKVDRLNFSYDGDRAPALLQDLSFIIPEGKVTAIVGSSGSGKTTLLKLLLKFYPPTNGDIYVGEQPLTRILSRNWLAQCGVVMQDGFMFDDTILSNVTESGSDQPLDRERLTHALRIAHLEHFVEHLPQGLKTKIGQNGMGLSGGQRQRILIARAVYKNPAYLFFDEATSALDAESERYIVNNLENFYQDRTVVIIAHRLSTVKHADQILVMDQGQVVEQGTHSELTYQKGRYYTLVKNQLELGT